MEVEGDFLLHLGSEISFSELYQYTYPPTSARVIIPQLMDQRGLEFLHRMVYQRYSTYKSVLKYFISMEIESFLLREQKTKVQKKSERSFLGSLELAQQGQILIIFPDNRSRFNILGSEIMDAPDTLHLYSSDTQNKKDQHRRMIKKGSSLPIIATHSEVFQPFQDLKKIILFDSHKRYYHNQQDPRYHLPVIAQKMSELY
ncbi:MAG: hypothetical protein LBI53_06530 [Candidatus Peribacteria bacterium]|nr:hypothetical protein [Candidatus Peribacteria bacterium]